MRYGKTLETQYSDLCEDRETMMDELQGLINKYVAKTMCSDECPCWSGYMVKETEQDITFNHDSQSAFLQRVQEM